MTDKLVYGVSTSVLFDMSEANAVFMAHGVDGYKKYMLDHLDEPLKKGKGFSFFESVQKDPNAEIVLCSQNSSLTGLRAMRTLKGSGLLPTRSCFTNGASPVPYLKAYGVDILLTSEGRLANEAHIQNIPSSVHPLALTEANMEELKRRYASPKPRLQIVGDNVTDLKSKFAQTTQTHFIFDMDCVLFDGESEQFYRDHGLSAYKNYEASMSDKPLAKGIYYPVLQKLNMINEKFPDGAKPYKISVVTARGAESTLRALNTLQSWGIDLTGEIHFMDGASKGPILKILNERNNMASIFMDDQPKNIEAAQEAGVFAGRVPSEIPNPPAA